MTTTTPPATTPPADTGIALTVRALRKSYGDRAAVDGLDFVAEPGTVTGFLGPNGAGKSTTLRILTGLARADEGEVLVGGRPYRSLQDPARTIGVMLDARALHGGRTGLETLRLAARTVGMPASRADEVLALREIVHVIDAVEQVASGDGGPLHLTQSQVLLLTEAAALYAAERDVDDYIAPVERERIGRLRTLSDRLMGVAADMATAIEQRRTGAHH